MNKNRHRIIFNAARGLRMAVAETATACGKSAHGEGASTDRPSGTARAVLRPLQLCLFAALGMLFVLSVDPAQAQIVADRQAPGNQQATVLQTGNGVPQVNIQTPSAAGVSRNTFSQFDVQRNGAVLNNSRTNVQTQLGGWVQGNPWLAGGSARIIVNEVNSANPSQLKGYIEVAGQRAEVIIANPAGIEVDGAGFINASRATLTTGTPMLNNGSLEGFRVQRGTISINGAGLDATLTDYTGILARAVQSNAVVWATNLKLVTGVNDISADQSEIRATDAAGTAPTFALDVAQLGGMYAGKIHLIGTEAGVGVRIDGTLGATAGDLVLQSNGWLSAGGSLQASGNTTIQLRGDMVNRGTVHAGSSQVVAVGGGLSNAGHMTAVGGTTITASALDNAGEIASGENLSIGVAGQTSNQGQLLAADQLRLTSTVIDNAQGSIQGRRLDVQAQSLGNQGGRIWQSGSQALELELGALDNLGDGQVGALAAAPVPGAGGATGGGTSGAAPDAPLPGGRIVIVGVTDNRDGTLAGQGRIDLHVDQGLRNTGVVSVSGLRVQGAELDNSGGDIRADEARVATTRLINDAGQIVASQALEVQAGSLANRGGLLSATGPLSLDVSNTLDNTGGTLQSTADTARVRAGDLTNTGTVFAAQDLHVQVQSLANGGSLYAQGNLAVQATDDLANSGGLAALGNTRIQAGSLSGSGAGLVGAGIRADGQRTATGDLHIVTQGALSAQGHNLAGGQAVLDGASLDLNGSVTAARDIQLNATQGDIGTRGASVVAQGSLSVQAVGETAQTLDNTQGRLDAAQLDIRAGNIRNQDGQILQSGSGVTAIAAAPTGMLDNTRGTIASNGRELQVQAGDLLNLDGRVLHAGTDRLDVRAQTLDNSGGQLLGNGQASILAEQMNNQLGSVGAHALELRTRKLDNRGGQLGATQAIDIGASERLDNSDGSIRSVNGSVNITGGDVTNLGGTVHASTDLNLDAAQLHNSGSLYANRDLSILAGGAVTNTGVIAAERDTRIVGDSLDSTQGSVLGAGVRADGDLSSAGDLTLSTRQQLHAHGSNLVAGDLTASGASIHLAGSQTRARDITLVASRGDIDTQGVAGDTPPPALALLSLEIPLYAALAFLPTDTDVPPSDCGNGVDCGPFDQPVPADPPAQSSGKTTIVATGRFSATANQQAQQRLINNHGDITAGQLDLHVANLDNASARLVQTGAAPANIEIRSGGAAAPDGALDNTQGLIALNADSGTVQAGVLHNTLGRIEHAGAGTLTLQADALQASQGEIASNGTLLFDARALDHVGALTRAQDIQVRSQDIDNAHGQMLARQNLDITAQGTLSNQDGLLQATHGSATLDVGAMRNSGLVVAGTDLNTHANSLHNDGTLYARGRQTLSADGTVTLLGTVAAQGDLSVSATSLQSAPTSLIAAGLQEDGTLARTGDLSIHTTGQLGAHGQNLAAERLEASGAAIDLSSSRNSAQDVALHATQGDINTQGATVVAGGTFSAQASQGLHNLSGVISAAQLDLQVARLDNRQGTLIQTGASDTRIGLQTADGSASGGTLDNTRGRILSNADNLDLEAGRIANVQGEIRHAGTGTLRLSATDIVGAEGSILSNGALAVQAVNLDHSRARTGAVQVAIDASALDNTRGAITQTGSEQATRISASNELRNDAGRIESSASVQLQVGELYNRQGRITAGTTLTGDVAGALDNTDGTLLADQAVRWQAGTIDNTRGIVASVASDVHLGSTGVLTNDSGSILADQGQVQLRSAALSNTLATGSTDGGLISGQHLGIDTSTQVLDNRSGTLHARQSVSLSTGLLDNTAGLVQAGTTLTVDTQGRALTNADARGHASGLGGLAAGGAASIATGDLDNRSGYIGAVGSLSIRAAQVDNTPGGTQRAQILSGQSLDLQASGLSNRGGDVQALSDLSIATGGGQIDNRDGLVRAGGQVTLDAVRIGNQDTLVGADRGIEGTDIRITTATLDNTAGAVRAEGDITLSSAGRIDNSRGLISAADRLHIQGPAITSADRTLVITNTGGTLLAGQRLDIQAKALGLDGKLLSRSDLSLTLQGDHTFAAGGQLAANRDLSLELDGDLTNSGQLQAGRTLSASARNITNTASGEISATTTWLEADQTLSNRGLIDGTRTRIDAGMLSNTGTGRIYGDELGIAAGTLVNDTETVDGVRRDAVIAARSRLDIGAQTLTNREGALIFSAGDMVIGGTLDASGQASGLAQAIHNNSATLESLGDMQLHAVSLRNTNDHFSVRMDMTSTPVVRLLHNGVEYDQSEIGLNFSPLNSYYNNAGWSVLLPGDDYPFSRFPADVGTWAKTSFGGVGLLGGGRGPFTIAGTHSTYRIGGRDNREEVTVVNYGPEHGIWQRFGVPAPVDPTPYRGPCGGERGWACRGAELATYNAHLAQVAAYQQAYSLLDQKITAFNASVRSRTLRDWTVLDYTRTEYTPVVASSAPGRILVGGDLRATVSAQVVNDKSQIIAGGLLDLRDPAGKPIAVQNIEAQAEAITQSRGLSVYSYYVEDCFFCNDDREYITTPYGTDEKTTVTLPVTQVLQNTLHTSGTRITTHSATSVQQPTAVTTAVDAVADLRAVDTRMRNPSQPSAVSGQRATKASGIDPDQATTAPARALGDGPLVPLAQGQTGLQQVALSVLNASGPGVAGLVQGTSGPSQANQGLSTQSGASGQLIRSTAPNTQLPTSALFQVNPGSPNGYLIETDPRFADSRQWLSSDYMLNALGLDPAATQKRLGDGFYEQRLVNEQINALTGFRYLGEHTRDDEQYQALLGAGATFAKVHQLRPGVALSDAQVAQLTSDIVWLVEEEITLADGSKTKALVPKVYVQVRPGDLESSGSLITGRDVNIDLGGGDLNNRGTIAGRNVTRINAANIHNLGGRIGGGQATVVQASQDLDNSGGSISAQRALGVGAGRDLKVASTTQSTRTQAGPNEFTRTTMDRVAGLYVSDQAGVLLASAGRDIRLDGALVQSGGNVQIQAGRDIQLGSVRTQASDQANWSAVNYLRSSQSTEHGSRIQATGNASVEAGQDINARAANVGAQGSLSVQAGRDIDIQAGLASSGYAEGHQSTQKGFLSKKTTTTRTSQDSTQAQASELGGREVLISSGQDTRITGSNVLADQDLVILSGRDLSIEAAQHTQGDSNFNETQKSGLFGSGGIGFTIGKQQQSQDVQNTQSSAAASTVGSVDGNVTLMAGQTYTQRGSDVLAPAGNIAISAQRVDIEEARESASQSVEQRFRQSGLSVAITSPVISGLQAAQSQLEAASDTRSDRMKALAVANAAMNLKQAGEAITAGQAKEGGNAADKTGGIGISISLGASKSQSQQSSSADSARGSSVSAGGDITIEASGAGENSNLTVRGSQVKAGGATRLSAEDEVRLLAARNTQTEANSQSSKSGSIGVGIQLGAGGAQMGVTASASAGKGQGAGNGTTYTNTRIEGQQVNITSGGDTTLKGAVVQGRQVAVNVGGNLTIQSLQDQSHYQEKSQQVGGSVTFGPAPGASLNAGQTKINSDYNSVGEQSALRAGDGGFQVSVAGKTDLVGGQITSSQAAIDNNKNSYQAQGGTSTRDLNNSASFEASGVSVGLSAGTPKPGASVSAGLSGVGIGSDSGSASSTTTAGISGIAGNTAARTGDAETGIKPIFNQDEARREVNAQVAITQEFGKQASKMVGDYAKEQYDKAKAAGDKDGMAAWEEGGKNRVALHVLVGGLTGGVQGAVGAGAASAAAPKLEELQADLKTALTGAGVGEDAAKLIASLAGGATAAGIGGATGGTAGAVTAFNADMNNRQLHPSERTLARQLAKKSGGKYTVEQIEEQMRLMGNLAFSEKPNTLAVMVGDAALADSIAKDPGMTRVGDGIAAVEVPGHADVALQQYIISNTTEGAGYIPGGSPYVLSDPSLNRPVTTNISSKPTVTATCANNDLACKSGVGVQQNGPITQQMREAIADGAASLSRQAGVIASGATAAAAAGSPQVKPIAGVVAVGATAVGVGADVVEQIMRPDMKQVFRDQLLLGVPAEVLTQRYPLYAPMINEIKEAIK